MSRRMSCSLTVDAVRDRTKTVTRRRLGTWRNLTAGDRLTLVEKAMGLPKGSTQVVLADVEVIAVNDLPLSDTTYAELVREGFPDEDPETWTLWWKREHGYGPDENPYVRRIEWKYIT